MRARAARGATPAPGGCERCGHVCPPEVRCPKCGGDPMQPGDRLCIDCAHPLTHMGRPITHADHERISKDGP